MYMQIYNLQFTIYKKILFLLFFVVIWLLFIPILTEAYTVEISVDTDKESVNAIEGVIVLPRAALVGDISLGDSAVLMWIKSPVVENGRVRFAGITPGGFTGKYPLFYISTDTAQVDMSQIIFESVSAVRSDGSGQVVPVRLSVSYRDLPVDTEMPEPFTPAISSSEDILNGEKFVVFAAQDNGTGVKYYETASTWVMSPNEDEWSREISPKVLSKTELFKKIHIKAVDDAGNYRVVTIHGPYWYATLAFGLIMFVCVLLFLNRSFFSRR